MGFKLYTLHNTDARLKKERLMKTRDMKFSKIKTGDLSYINETEDAMI